MSGMRLMFAVAITLLIQLTLVRKIAIFGVQPDLTVVLLVLLSLRRGPSRGALLGFAIGLLQDLLVPETLGMNALAKSIVGWSMGKVSSSIAVKGPPLYFAMVALAVLAHDFIYLAALTHLDLGRLLLVFATNSIPAAIYSGAVSMLIGAVAGLLHGGFFGQVAEARRG